MIPTFSEIIQKIKGIPSHEEIQQKVSPAKNYKLRGIDVSEEDLSELKKVLFSEISNRPDDKKKLESDVILNTVLNRIPEHKKYGKNYTIKDIVQMPNQYQGYEPKGRFDEKGNYLSESQYQIYSKPDLDEPTRKKKEFVDNYVEQLKTNDIIDNTEGAFYYIHNPDSTITYDNLKPLYKK